MRPYKLSTKRDAVITKLRTLFIAKGLQERYTDKGTAIAYDYISESDSYGKHVVFHFDLFKSPTPGFVPQFGHMRGVIGNKQQWVPSSILDKLWRQLESYYVNRDPHFPMITLSRLTDPFVIEHVLDILSNFLDTLNGNVANRPTTKRRQKAL